MRPRSGRLALVTATWLATGTFSGCGPAGEPAPATTRSTPATAGASPSTSPSEPGSGPGDEATVEPPDGRTATLGRVSLTFPRGWNVRQTLDLAATSLGPDMEQIIFLRVDSPTIERLGVLARRADRTTSWKGRSRRLEDLVVDGTTFFHLRGPGLLGTTHVVGAETATDYIEIEVSGAGDDEATDALFASVLAGVSLG